MTKNKKICILTSVHPVFCGRIFQKQAKTLAGVNYEVFLIAQHSKKETREGIKIIPLKKPQNRLERFTKTGFSLYRKALSQQADIYHFHDPELIFWMILLKIKTGAKIVYDIHEDVPNQILSKRWLPLLIRRPLSLMVSFLENLSVQFFDAVVLATPTISNHIYCDKKVVIYNFPILRGDFFKNYISYSKRPQSFVYPGAITGDRGIKETIQAITLLDDFCGVKFELAGTFSSNKVMNRLMILPGWSLVNYYGEISSEKVVSLLSNARAGIVVHQPIPNEVDALPVKVFEYMAAGLPIIASDFPRLSKIIEKINCGILVNPLKPEEIAEAMRWILKHPAKAEAMGKRGRQAVESTYNWGAEEEKLLSLYKEL
jgi:glycosyltransferase involved in cell wall biosynthesis